jgi:putative flippase GtrA
MRRSGKLNDNCHAESLPHSSIFRHWRNICGPGFRAVAVLVKGFGVKWYYANVVSFTLINLVHYALSIHFVFESGTRFGKHQEILLTFLTSVVGLLVNQLALYVLVSFLGLDVLIAKIGAIGTTFFWNYLVRQNFIFRKPHTPGPPEIA